MDANERRRAFDHAAEAMDARDRTVAEMRTYLERKRIEPDLIDLVIADLRDTALLDDEGFARRFAESKRSLQGWGSGRIERELERRGVPAGTVEEVLAAQGVEDERRAAIALLGERYPRRLEGDRERDRAWRLLVRRGYEPELAYEAIHAHSPA